MKKIYLIERIVSANGKVINVNIQYNAIGFFTNKEKAASFIQNGAPVELLDSNYKSYIPQKKINEYRITEVNVMP